MAKKLSSKANYVSKRNIKSITVQRGKKTTEIASKDLIDGAYVKKGVKFKKGGNTNELKAKKRLEELRKELRAERISYSELLELQSLAKYIDKNDVELLEAAGVDEFRTGGILKSKEYIVVCKDIKTGEEQEFEVMAESKFDAKEMAMGMCDFSNPKIISVELFRTGGNVNSDILKYKKQLIAKAKSKGLYENFGQKEVTILEDKYGFTKEVKDFYDWVSNFDLSDLNQYRTGGVAGRTSIEIDIVGENVVSRNEIKKEWKKYGITGVFKKVDDQQDYAVITGTKENLKAYLLSEEYGMEADDLEEIFPEIYRTGGVAGSKHVDVTKGYRLPHGYKAVKGEDRNRNYSKGKPKVKVDAGWRLPKGYEVVDGAYNMKYEDGGMVEAKISREFSNLQNGVKASYEKLFTEIVDSLESDFDVNRNVAFNKVFNVSSWDKTKKFLNEGYAPNQVAQMFYKGEFGKMKYENGGMMGDNMNDCYCYEIGGL